MPRSEVWTLPQAARLLGEPQHRLIYLCEKRVVVPDLADASGRGSSRRFSSRNLLEFAVALRLRTLGLPAASIAAILYTLRAFEKRVASEIPGFEIVEALRAQGGIDVRAIVRDGDRLYFLLRQPGQGARLFGGAQLGGTKSSTVSRLASRVHPVFKAIVRPDSGGFEGPEGSQYVRLDINIARIARDLKLEE
jgi:DNA-binding transcriptional MerR regulator